MTKPTCIICSSEFENTTGVSKAKYLKRKYCSRKCSSIGTAKERLNEEAKRKLSIAHKGKKFTQQHRENISKGLKASKKAEKFWFKKGKGNPLYGRNQTGSANANWKGGITNSNQQRRNDPRLKEWRTKVFERDNFTCQHCLQKGYLHAHHIVPFSQDFSKAFDLDNGITLCVECHEKVHGRFIGKFKQKS